MVVRFLGHRKNAVVTGVCSSENSSAPGRKLSEIQEVEREEIPLRTYLQEPTFSR